MRVSGLQVRQISKHITKQDLKSRLATLADFQRQDGSVIDRGIVILFPGPRSFTGEDVVELQGHGGPVVMQMLLERVCELGARLAQPGEFTERAFLNSQLDLTQAEAVADLIASSSEQAARAAFRSLTGEFSDAVNSVDRGILKLRAKIEACLDFPEEDLDFLANGELQAEVGNLNRDLNALIESAKAGSLLASGFRLAIGGMPNVGKSSLLNRLVGEDRAIVTPIAGTTRDVVEGNFQIDGLPISLADTAGLRESNDPLEILGIDRARKELASADLVLWVSDDRHPSKPPNISLPVIHLLNKCDLTNGPPGMLSDGSVRISALTGDGIPVLLDAIRAKAGYSKEGVIFVGRPRHIFGLSSAFAEAQNANRKLLEGNGELAAEALRLAHEYLGAIVGVTTADDVLSEIFSSFCIGK